mmetsp:Transcript_101143/g.271687  ORF Transcript_101143/g.271687 Transcript_101143/m.271687 type:complete len:501 (+) Transcript_101143:73-1575(+)
MAMAPKRLNTSQSEGDLSVNSKMSASRREKLMNIKKREEMKDALTEKFKSRFSSGGAGRAADEMSVCSSAIRQEVDQFASLANVTSSNLSKLERRIQNKAQGVADDQVSVYSAAPSQLSRSRSATSMAGANIAGSPTKTFDWSKLDEYASYLHEQDCIRQHMGVKALQKKLKMDLDQQVALKQNKKGQEVDEDAKYHQNSMIELERWKQMEMLREEEKSAKVMREKDDRDAQLNYEKKIKSEEANKKKSEESALVTKIVSEMESEQKKFEKKKEQTRKNMRKVFEENAKDQAKKTEEEQEAKDRESAQLKEYARALDEQEEQRQAEMQARLQRQNDLMAKLQANVDGIKKGAGDNDAQRALAQQEEMDRHFFEAENVKQNRLKQLRVQNQAYLLKQMDEKDGRKAGDRELSDIQAQILSADTSEYNEVERLKVVNRRSHLVEHSKDIKKQMAYKLAQSQPVMSEAEIMMNKPLLQLVERTLENRERAFPQTIPEGEEDEE